MKLSIFKRAFHKDINILRVSFFVILLTIIGGLFWFSVFKYEQSADIIEGRFKQRDCIIEKAILADESKLQQ